MLKFSILKSKAWLSESTQTMHNDVCEIICCSHREYRPSHLDMGRVRRSSLLTKISIDLALDITSKEKVDHIVFSSQHGEVSASYQLLQSISKNEILSPTVFSQSVHNVTIGQLSLLTNNNAATTAIAAGNNSFMSGLISSLLYLNENPEHSVLYVSGEGEMPSEFVPQLKEKVYPHAIAILLGNKGHHRFSIKSDTYKSDNFNESFFSDSIQFILGIASGQNEFEIKTQGSSWRVSYVS